MAFAPATKTDLYIGFDGSFGNGGDGVHGSGLQSVSTLPGYTRVWIFAAGASGGGFGGGQKGFTTNAVIPIAHDGSDVFSAIVGGSPQPSTAGSGLGGYNGGGRPGGPNGYNGGGGRTDLFLNGHRIAILAGGGGYGYTTGRSTNPEGGSGGGVFGAAFPGVDGTNAHGSFGSPITGAGLFGHGASLVAVGAGGLHGSTDGDGSNGSGGVGGDGGAMVFTGDTGIGGGGGGGGLFGGGGGGAGHGTMPGFFLPSGVRDLGAGAGGGSAWYDPTFITSFGGNPSLSTDPTNLFPDSISGSDYPGGEGSHGLVILRFYKLRGGGGHSRHRIMH